MDETTDPQPKPELDSAEAIQRQEANTCIGAGVGVAVFGAGAAALTGAVCPLCIVATPLLIGVGLYKRLTLKTERSNDRR